MTWKKITEQVTGILPSRLYHATTALSKVLSEGLKSNAERDTEASGLGAFGQESHVSLTDDPEIAHRIADSIHEARNAILGHTTVQNMLDEANRGGYGDRVFSSWISNEGQEVLKGLAVHRLSGGTTLDSLIDEATKRRGGTGWQPHWDSEESRSLLEPHGLYTAVSRPMTEEEHEKSRFNLYRLLSSFREFHGGPIDPMFVGHNLHKTLKTVDPSEVGVVEVEPHPGATGTNLAGPLSEWRVDSGNVFKNIRNITRTRT